MLAMIVWSWTNNGLSETLFFQSSFTGKLSGYEKAVDIERLKYSDTGWGPQNKFNQN